VKRLRVSPLASAFLVSAAMLGHDADQVRVELMHALAGLARTRPDVYAQTVLDVLCACLRLPAPAVRPRRLRVIPSTIPRGFTAHDEVTFSEADFADFPPGPNCPEQPPISTLAESTDSFRCPPLTCPQVS
jgi:hypothetical protein